MFQVCIRSMLTQCHSIHVHSMGSKKILGPPTALPIRGVGMPYNPRPARRRRYISVATRSSYITIVKFPTTSLFLNSCILTWNQSNRSDGRYFTTEQQLSPPQTNIAAVGTVDANDMIASVTNDNDQCTILQSQREIFHKLLYDDAAYVEAYNLLTTAVPAVTSISTTEPNHPPLPPQTDNDCWKHNAYIQLFDAVIAHHGTLLDAYNRDFPTMMKSSMYSDHSTTSTANNTTTTTTTPTTTTNTTTASQSMANTITPDQVHTLRQMIQMAEIANNCIEMIEPYLGARNASWMMHRSVEFHDSQIDMNAADDDENDDENDNGDSAHEPNDDNDNDDEPSYDRNDQEHSAETAAIDDDDNDAAAAGISKSDRPNEHMRSWDRKTESTLSTSQPTPTPTTSTTKRKPSKKPRREIDLDLMTRCNDVLTAWAQTVYAGYRGNASRSYLRAIPQRAQFLLSRMEHTVEDESYPGDLVPPSLLSYNSVLQTWAYSCEHLRGASAQLLFDKLMSNMIGTAYGDIRPDGESHRLIIWAWALSRERRAAFIATGHLIKMLRRLEVGFDDDALYEGAAIEPSIDDYNIVAQAWIRSEEKNSPGKAQSMLKLMERVYKKGVTMLQPSLLCYKCVFLAAAKRHDLPGLGPLIDETLGMMRDRFIVPDTDCYTAAIKTWKNAAIHQPDVTVANQQSSVRRAIELLEEMDVAHNQSMMVSISVSTENINDVLEALTVSTHHSRTSIVDDLLNKLSPSQTDGTSIGMTATAESYIYAIRVWSTVESMEKVAKGKAILWRVKDDYAELVRQHNNKRDNRRKDQIVDIFNEYVQLCASYQPQSDKDGLQVLGEALDAIRVMRSMDVSGSGLYHKLIPNAATFASLLIAVANLLSPGSRERRVAVENIFMMCCTDGMVDDVVLQCFRDAATSDQYATMVESKSEIVEGMKVVPESWTMNALGGKVKSADGRKTIPLGVDGLLKRTTAMKEFQMRRLLDHRNRDLLRGGRWRQKATSKYYPQLTNSNDTNYHALKPWKLYDGTVISTN